MFRIAKYLLYAALAVGIVFLFWFLPKYSYVQKNPGYCVNLTQHLYYCGSDADLKATFETTKASVPKPVQEKFKAEVKNEIETQIEQSTQP